MVQLGRSLSDVWLHTTAKLYVTDAVYADTVAGGGIFVTYPVVNSASAQIQIKTQVKNENPTSKTCTVKSFWLMLKTG